MSDSTSSVGHRDLANAIRALSIDAVEKAASGHPGMPMGMADTATVLFTRFLKFDPSEPKWPDRDRFVLSAGHGSMLLYSLLHLTGYSDITIEDIKNFRQLGSPCAGHPEYGHGAGVETTTGPLGQGIATAVGMALGERILAARFGDDLVDHYTYVIASDGDLMEGISHEAISLAGHLRLSRLIVLFDDNGISIDGPTSLTESGDQVARFEAAGWSASRVDGHDPEAVAAAIESAKASDRPSLIACRTIIGYGAPKKQGTASAHGSALGAEEAAAAKAALGWSYPPFEIPAHIRSAWLEFGKRGKPEREQWQRRLVNTSPDVQAGFKRAIAGELPAELGAALSSYRKALTEKPVKVATRKASEMALEVVNANVAETIGGSADLTGSNNTRTKGMEAIEANDFRGRFIHYGVREHGMAAAMNGLALHGGIIPYSGTFLVFSDYCRPSIRLAALMGQRVIHVMTHDSIGLGEDGPTHQPVEHLSALRAIPNLNVFRPADAVETAECWEIALRNTKTPSVMALSRQNLAQVRLTHSEQNLSAKGAYVLEPANGKAQVTLIATGSEVEIAVQAKKLLETEGIATTLVSMPCMDLFEQQDPAYRISVIDPTSVRVAVEAGISMSWDRWIGDNGAFIGMTTFGASAPYQILYKHFGITPENIVKAAKARL
ncbi:MAG: transketolase [Alphaproteobacteria bacterium]|nr:transketolase [Alphaproteobacteria bacterium]